MDSTILIGLAGILAAAAPVLFAVIGETITERAGVTNLSVNGTIILSAMAGFAAAVSTQSLLLGFIAGAFVGALVAAHRGIYQHHPQAVAGGGGVRADADVPRPGLFSGQPFHGSLGTAGAFTADRRAWKIFPYWERSSSTRTY